MLGKMNTEVHAAFHRDSQQMYREFPVSRYKFVKELRVSYVASK